MRKTLVLLMGIMLFSMAKAQNVMDEFVSQLMSKMTLEEKIGQLNLNVSSGFVAGETTSQNAVPTIEGVAKGEIGGIFGLRGSSKVKEWQRKAVNESRLHIPLLFGLDIIHGYEVTFPIPLALASSWNPSLVESVARISAKEASLDGVCWTFSPMVDICRDARWGRIAESSGEDPYLGGVMAQSWVKGYQTDNDLSHPDNIMACMKHYALYGGAEAGRDYNTVDMSRQRAFNEYMLPYKQALEQGVGSAMASFNEFEGIPVTGNKYLLDDVLRKKWGFSGLLISDYTGIMEMTNHGVGNEKEVASMALKATVDMDMCSGYYAQYLRENLANGSITEADIDNACRRVLEAKYKLGLFDDPYQYCSGGPSQSILKANQSKARETAAASMVLLKNKNNTLPLKKGCRIALIGPMADRANDMLGTWAGWSETIKPVSLLQGLEEAAAQCGGYVDCCEGSWLLADSILETKLVGGNMGFVSSKGEQRFVHSRSEEDLLSEALSMADKADVVVAALGENINMNGEGASRTDPSIPEPQERLLKALVSTGKPVILVVFTGRPLVLSWEDDNVDAILNAWFPGVEAGHAIADVLYGYTNPSAKIPVSFPRHVGQIPVFYNHKNTGRPAVSDDAPYVRFKSNYIDLPNSPLYPFGFGLSYTTFEYGTMKMDADTIKGEQKINVSVEVTNTGLREGLETVQLYIQDVHGSVTRPVKELKGFEQIRLKPGETRRVTFVIDREKLKFYNHDLDYIAEPGDFQIMVGPNSRDTQQQLLTLVI